MSALGNSLIIAGVLIIVATLYLGYLLYTSLSSLNLQLSVPPTSNVTKSLGSFFNSLLSNSGSFIVLIVKILLLFLFASIGYKIAALGIEQNKVAAEVAMASAEEEKEESSEKRKEKVLA